MGKSNRIRKTRAIGVKKPATAKNRNKKGMPGWLMTLLTIVITVAILGGVALSLLSSNGVFGRMDTIVRSENYKVNANMMAYFFYTNYNDFYSNYSSYLGDMLDTSVSLKEQNYSEATETTPAVTWYDYFMDQTVESVKSMLYYCEEADALDVTLDKEDLAQIEEAIDTIAMTASTNGYSTNAYIATIYGPGVQVSDVRKAMTYSTLASKCMNHISLLLEEKITDDRISETYGKDKRAYNVVDYTYYTFSVSYTDIAKEVLGENYTEAELNENKNTVLEAYKAAIQEAKDKADALKSDDAVSVSDFEKAIFTHEATKSFETTYKTKTVADEDKPSDADLETIKAAMIEEVVAEVMGDKITEDAAKDNKAYGVEVTEAYATTINSVKTAVTTAVSTVKKSNTVDKAYYSESSDAMTWAFAEERGVGDTTVIRTGDGSKEDDTFEKPSSASISVYLLRETQRADESHARNVSYMLLADASTAKKAIRDLKEMEELTPEAFDAYAEESNAVTGHSNLENCTKGYLGNDTFDEWLFNESMEEGTLTTTPLKIDDSTQMVAYYYGEGDEVWRVAVFSTILSEDFESYYADMTAKYETTIKVQESLDDVVMA